MSSSLTAVPVARFSMVAPTWAERITGYQKFEVLVDGQKRGNLSLNSDGGQRCQHQ
jgi:hypothetical protein